MSFKLSWFRHACDKTRRLFFFPDMTDSDMLQKVLVFKDEASICTLLFAKRSAPL